MHRLIDPKAQIGKNVRIGDYAKNSKNAVVQVFHYRRQLCSYERYPARDCLSQRSHEEDYGIGKKEYLNSLKHV